MIGILADTPHDAELMRGAVVGGVRVIHTASDLSAADLGIECLVFGSRSGLLAERIAVLREVERKLPWVPVILVTDRKIAIARLLSRVQVADLVWFEDIERQLASRIESACSGSALLQMAEKIRRSTAPPALRSAVAHALREARRTPVRNVQELAAAVDCSPVTLFQQFQARALGRTTFNRFLGALAILRAQQLRASGSKWKHASAQLGLPRETLRRKAKRWLGCNLLELERIPPHQLLAAFALEHFAPLLEPPPRDAGA
ncbi:MAG: hypothetical protein F4164_03985 [Gemmatimonadales bacterium]|nr:hypothetical protein [Gemmatimonadales bacterium]MYG48536.1 hypothetical protein [Gemmatimonadales bacterium]MYK02348.1 hypothetical protein [Candidatus Palauibacter ramosifaciens]